MKGGTLAEWAERGEVPRFDAAAQAQGADWSEALLHSLDARRQAALQEGFEPSPDHDWFRAAGPGRMWMVARMARQWLREVRDRSTRSRDTAQHAVFAWTMAAQAFPSRPETAWLHAEVFAAIPSSVASVAKLMLQPPPLGRTVAWLHVLDHERVPNRKLLVEHLDGQGAWDLDRALAGLLDRSLRTVSASRLSRDLEARMAELEALTEHPSKGVRSVALQLIRQRRPTAGSPPGLAELEAQLRAHPRDPRISAVWADALLSRGDIRGRIVALEHEILAATDAAAQLKLSEEQATLSQRHRSEILGRPGGFPFRDDYRGRHALRYASAEGRTVGPAGVDWLERIAAFLVRLTDVDEVTLHTRARSTRHRPSSPTLRRQVARNPTAWIEATDFRLTHPGVGLPLPHQEGGHYAGGAPLRSQLRCHPEGGTLSLELWFPFEEPDARFMAWYNTAERVLGKVFAPQRLRIGEPNQAGDGLKTVRTAALPR